MDKQNVGRKYNGVIQLGKEGDPDAGSTHRP